MDGHHVPILQKSQWLVSNLTVSNWLSINLLVEFVDESRESQNMFDYMNKSNISISLYIQILSYSRHLRISGCPWVPNCSTTWANMWTALPACWETIAFIWRSIRVASRAVEDPEKGSRHIWSLHPSMTAATWLVFLLRFCKWIHLSRTDMIQHQNDASVDGGFCMILLSTLELFDLFD